MASTPQLLDSPAYPRFLQVASVKVPPIHGGGYQSHSVTFCTGRVDISYSYDSYALSHLHCRNGPQNLVHDRTPLPSIPACGTGVIFELQSMAVHPVWVPVGYIKTDILFGYHFLVDSTLIGASTVIFTIRVIEQLIGLGFGHLHLGFILHIIYRSTLPLAVRMRSSSTSSSVSGSIGMR